MSGLLISGIVLIPVIYAFLNSGRSEATTLVGYRLSYYAYFLSDFLRIAPNYWRIIGVASISVLSIPFIFSRRKEYKTFFYYFIVLTIVLLIPIAGSILNGFSFPSNRWSFAYCFISSVLTAIMLEHKGKFTNKEYILMFCSIAIFTVTSFIASRAKINWGIFIPLLISVAILVLLLIPKFLSRQRAEKIKNKLISKIIRKLVYNWNFSISDN